jgi:hypothetical protein
MAEASAYDAVEYEVRGRLSGHLLLGKKPYCVALCLVEHGQKEIRAGYGAVPQVLYMNCSACTTR